MYKTAAREVYNIKRAAVALCSLSQEVSSDVSFILISYLEVLHLSKDDRCRTTHSVRFSINPALGMASRRFHAPVILKLPNSYMS